MLGRFLLFSFSLLLLCTGSSFEEEALALLGSQGIDLTDLAAGSTTKERKNALQGALVLIRGQIVKQIADIKSDYAKRETSRLAVRDKKLDESNKAKVAYDAALGTYKALQDLSNKADVIYKSENEDDLEETNRLIGNIDGVIRILANILNNGKLVTWLSDDWSLGNEKSRGVIDQTSGPDRAFCGLSRRAVFKLRRCRAFTKGLFFQSTSDQKEVKLPLTGSRSDWTRECPDNQYFGSISSTYSDDRRWVFGCKSFNQIVTKTCAWTGTYLDSFDFTCPDSKVLAGIKRDYSSRLFFFKRIVNRRYSFKCCEVVAQ